LISFGQLLGPVGAWDIGAMAAKSATISRPTSAITRPTGGAPRMADRLFRRQARRYPADDPRLPLEHSAGAPAP
jgi:hypothetical protein